MQLDRHMMERLLTMDDAQLGVLIRSIAAEAGIDPSQLGMDTTSIQSIHVRIAEVSGSM